MKRFRQALLILPGYLASGTVPTSRTGHMCRGKPAGLLIGVGSPGTRTGWLVNRNP